MHFLRDPVSSASHFLMAAVAVFVGLYLVRITRAEGSRRLSVIVFACSMVLLYTASGLFHAVRVASDRLLIFQLLDMSAIYVMIAGSVTPIAAILVRGRLRIVLIAGQWAFAAIGILALWCLPKPEHHVLVACYLGMAWFGFTGLGHYWRATGWSGAKWLLACVGIYVAGAIVDLSKWPVLWPQVIGSHEVLHFCDIGGTACYLVFLVKFVIPYSPVEGDLVAEAQATAEPAAQFATPGQVG